MYVCLCNGVTDKAVRDAARSGVDSLAVLTSKTGCGTCCGSCLPLAQEILEHEQSAARSREPAMPLALSFA